MSLRSTACLLCLATPLMSQPLAPRDLEPAFEFGAYDDPVFLTHAGDGSGRVFVVERPGTIRVLHPDSEQISTFLEHRNDVNSRPGEGGLLSVAFHPGYASNGRLFVYYTRGNLVSRVAEFRVADDPDAVDPTSELVLLEVDQPAGNHNGGQLAFGPDGMLYIGLGDGGGANDQFGHGQDPTSLLGTILRIDVDGQDAGLAYAVPADNPFVGNDQGWREEIWAWGLRNPWRFSFDRVTGQLWTGDVGQGSREEIDLIVKGGNYGWSIAEGFRCFRSSPCDDPSLEPPIVDYGRGLGVSVTGGYVYRGHRLSQLYGAYVYGDFGSGRIWALRLDPDAEDGDRTAEHAQIARTTSAISSFGEDEAGELYVVGFEGRIWRFAMLEGEEPRPSAVAEAQQVSPDEPALAQNFPNPFNADTQIEYRVATAGPVRLAVYDLHGQRLQTLIQRWHEAGRYRYRWSRAGLASGTYLYELRLGDVTLRRKMTLLK